MIIKDIRGCEYSRVMDETFLCELLHPDKDDKNINMDLSIAHAILGINESSLPHKLKTSVEIYYILEGKGIMHIDNEAEEVQQGQIIYIPANSTQYIENIGNEKLKFLCIVSPMWKEEDEKLV